MREQGPAAPGGIPTFAGTAGSKPVHWLGWNDVRAEELEKQFTQVSRLKQLMIRNAFTLEGLTRAERIEAADLIETEPESQNTCWTCEDRKKAVGDTGLCRSHNRYALITRK